MNSFLLNNMKARCPYLLESYHISLPVTDT